MSNRRLPAALALRATLLLATALAAAVGGAAHAADPTYAALRAARPDGRTLEVAGVTVERDAFRFHLERGKLYFLAPVAGRTVGAVFLGEGSYELVPASDIERRHLALLAGEDQLARWSDRFDRLLLLFTDDTYEALVAAHAPSAGAPDARAVAAFDDFFGWQKSLDHFAVNLQLRLLADLLERPAGHDGVFLAMIDGKKLAPALAAVDPRGADALGLGEDLGGEEIALYSGNQSRRGFWYLAHRQAELAQGQVAPYRRPADAEHYRIETRVVHNTEIEGEARLRLRVLAPGLRVLPLHLMRKLRIAAVEWTPGDGEASAQWRPAEWVQEGETEDSDAAVVFPTALAAQTPVALHIRYAGKEVLADAGDSNYVVGARDSWYPNVGTFADPATFELVFHTPRHTQVVAVGTEVESHDDGVEATSTWRSAVPLRVAGFNYGRFKTKERDDKDAGLHLAVFTNPGTPAILREIQAAMAVRTYSAQGGSDGVTDSVSQTDFNVAPAPNVTMIDTAALAESALVDGINAARVYRGFFGPTHFDHVAITQQSQWSFGQSWPTLLFLPYWSFLHGGIRQQLGLQGLREEDAEGLSFHELSHQWWGHEVGWASYHDQWLSEGFADFSAALVLELSHGRQAADRFYQLKRKFLLERPAGNAVRNDEAGPISLGWRLADFRAPAAYAAVVYGKGAFVLNMLRMMMRDVGAPNPDAPFIAMMHDFVSTYSGKNPSTADFQHTVERHMLPAMNATGDGKMDWFFQQWVDGTEIPRVDSSLAVERDGDGYRIHGRVSQQGVSATFRTLLPVYVELPGKDRKRPILARIATLPMIGSLERTIDFRVKLPAKPSRVLLNAHYDVLTRD